MSGPGDAEIRSAPPSMARHARWKPEQAPNKSRGRPAMPDDRGNTPKRIGREVLPAPGSGKLTTDYRNSVATWNCCQIDTRPAGAGLRLKHTGRDREIAFAEAVALFPGRSVPLTIIVIAGGWDLSPVKDCRTTADKQRLGATRRRNSPNAVGSIRETA